MLVKFIDSNTIEPVVSKNYKLEEGKFVTDPNLLSPAELASYNIYELVEAVVEPYEMVISKSYTVSNGKVVEQVVKQNIDTAALKDDKLYNLREKAKSLLARTDWHVIRNLEKGTEIPANIITRRDSIRAKYAQLVAAINNDTLTLGELADGSTGLEEFEPGSV